jgi:hypothetical protein
MDETNKNVDEKKIEDTSSGISSRYSSFSG